MSDDVMAAILNAARLLDQGEREQMEFYSYSLMPPRMCWRDVVGTTTRFVAHADTWAAAIEVVAPAVERPPFVALISVWGVPIKNLDKDDKARREVMGGLFERMAERAGLAAGRAPSTAGYGTSPFMSHLPEVRAHNAKVERETLTPSDTRK